MYELNLEEERGLLITSTLAMMDFCGIFIPLILSMHNDGVWPFCFCKSTRRMKDDSVSEPQRAILYANILVVVVVGDA